MERTPVESLRKGLEVLELLAAAGVDGLPLAEVAARMDYKRTSAHNLLKTLAMCGYALNDGDGRYRLGPKLGRLVRHHRAGGALPAAMLQAVVELAGELDENVVLTTLAGGRRRVLARATGSQLVQVDGERLEGGHTFQWGLVTGRVLAAFADADELDELVADSGLPGSAWGGIATRADLDAALAAVVAAGLAEDHGHAVASLAVPVRADGELLGALGIHLPGFRWRDSKRDHCLAAMRRTAARLAELWYQ